jgi:transposase
MKELYAGVDIHKEKYVGCIVDKEGKVIREHTFPPTKEGAQSFLCGLPVKAVAIEACGMWRAALRLFRELGYEVKLTSPKKTKDIAGRKKTDKVDAKTLAELLRTGFLPYVYIPNDKMLCLRDLARHKAQLTRARARIQRKIRAILIMNGIKQPKGLWSRKGEKWLSEIGDENVANWLRLYKSFKAEEKEVMKRIRKIANSTRLTNLLMTIPGVAEFSSLMILEEIADIKRFKTPKELVMYAGLCPGIYQTGNTERDIRNHAVNKWLKWIITECSGRAATMKNTKFMYHYTRIKQRKNAQIARRSTARKMLTIIWHMLQKEEPYHHAA